MAATVDRIDLGELAALARAARIPLPFALPDPVAPAAKADVATRLGGGAGGHGGAAQEARRLLMAAAESAATRPAPSDPLTQWRTAALALLAVPQVLVQVDLATGRGRLCSWIALGGPTLVQLSLVGGPDVELLAAPVATLAVLLARTADVGPDDPADPVAHPTAPAADPTVELLPERIVVELDLLAAAGTLAQDTFVTTTPDGARLVRTLPATGRLRMLVTARGGRTVGLVSWVRLDGGWWSLRPDPGDPARLVEMRRVVAGDLAVEARPLLARALSGRDGVVAA